MSRVGVFFNARREQGGLYQYARTLLDCLVDHAELHQFIVFDATLNGLELQNDNPRVSLVSLPQAAVKPRMLLELFWLRLARSGLRRGGWIPEYAQISRSRLDALLYVKPGIHPFLWSQPGIFPIHDLQHRLQPHFPEVSAGGEYQRREYIYRNAIPRASAILTDSDVGRQDVIQLYGADPAIVHPLPYLAAVPTLPSINDGMLGEIRERYSLPGRYFFYPAAFWQHKNHARVVDAVRWLRDDRSLSVHMVFAGGLRHEYPRIAEQVAAHSLTSQVHFLGYVPDDHLPLLYAASDGLVMPTYFGPTNIPILEAWHAGCPVVTSDLRGIREQVGPAGILVDPDDVRAIADAMHALYNSPLLRQDLTRKGKRRVAEWTPKFFARRLEEIIQTALSGKAM